MKLHLQHPEMRRFGIIHGEWAFVMKMEDGEQVTYKVEKGF